MLAMTTNVVGHFAEWYSKFHALALRIQRRDIRHTTVPGDSCPMDEIESPKVTEPLSLRGHVARRAHRPAALFRSSGNFGYASSF